MPKNFREEIGLNDTISDVFLKLSEGNPGALSVIAQVAKELGDLGVLLLLSVDDMNMRGSQIWIGYKDHCGEDIKKFIECVRRRDRAMVDKVNEVILASEGPNGHKAVTGGASNKRGE